MWTASDALLGPWARDLPLLLLKLLATAWLTVSVGRMLLRFEHCRRVISHVPLASDCHWLLGHALVLGRAKTPWELMHNWVKANPPIVRWRLLFRHALVVCDPEALRRIMQTNLRMYEKDLFSYQSFLPVLGTGLVTSNGKLWQSQRLLMAPALRVEILDHIVSLAKRLTDLLSEWLENVRGSGRPVDIEFQFRNITLQVIGAAVLSLSPEECSRVFPRLYLEAIDECNQRILQPWRKFLPTASFFRFRDRIHKLDSYITNIFRTRWQQRKKNGNPEKGDILDRILDAIEDRGDTWDSKLETQLCYEIKTFLLAGHETSAEMLTWALYELTRNEDYLHKVQEEAFQVFGDAELEPPRSAVDGMEFTLSILKETLRRYTPVPLVTRNFIGDKDNLLGYQIPKGTLVVLHLEGVHMLYKDPLKFDPNRFMPGGEYDSFDNELRPFMFVPFIQGPRNCLGQHLALLEGRIVLSLLVKRFKFTRVSSKPVNPKDVIPVCPEGGMMVYVD